jgi:hypothetical protein
LHQIITAIFLHEAQCWRMRFFYKRSSLVPQLKMMCACMKAPPTTPFSPPPQTPSMNSPPALLAQQHDMNPVMQQQMLQVHQKEAEQLQQAPLATQQAQPHKQTLQQAHAEAQQHFQQSHHAMESPALPPPVQPSGTGIYAMVIMLAGLGLHALVHNALQHGTHFVTNAGICKDCATFLVLIVS